MTARLGIALVGAALAGVVAASLASGPVGAPIAERLIVPAGAFGGNVLGTPGSAVPALGAGPTWLLLRTLPDQVAPAAPPAPAAVVAVAPAHPAPPAAERGGAPVAAILTSAPVHPPAPLHLVHALPVSLPVVALPHPGGAAGLPRLHRGQRHH